MLRSLPNYLAIIVLYAIQQFRGERSIYAIYHMLQGKKSSQTIQDAHLFRLTTIFGTIPQITRPQLDSIIQTLVTYKWIQYEKADMFIITQIGESQLATHDPVPAQLNGWKYQNRTHVFWERLNLLIQTLSHMINKQPRFYPIQRNPKIQQAIKQFLQKHKQNRELLAAQIYEEIVELLEEQTDIHQEIFVRKLTGNNRIGETFEQLAVALEQDEWYVRLLFLESIHRMLAEIERQPRQYGLVAALMGDVDDSRLTQSTRMTLHYLQEGRSLSEIAVIRQLKVNTIEDHIVELVLANRQFPIDDYVSIVIEKNIIEAITKLQTKQLKVIKQELADEDIHFFQIRLVLAKIGGDI